MNGPHLGPAAIARLYARGLSCAKIAERDGRSEGTIYNILVEQGIKIRSRSEANQTFPTAKAILLYNLGLSTAQIGSLLKVHQTTVVKRLQTTGFPLRPADVAAKIMYTEEEIARYFGSPAFLNWLDRMVA